MAVAADLVPGSVVEGPLLPEPVEVLVVVPIGTAVKLIGKGLRTGQVHEPILNADQLQQLTATPKEPRFDGDPAKFKLGIEAARLGLAYEYDPYFSLSIARIDPLPHQLEAVYDYFPKLPRIRFLLADDPGAGKTIMAGLLLKELKIRGLVTRTLIVAPANLTFQWQREMKDKFRESFDVMRGEVLRTQYGQNPWQEHNQVVTSVSWISRVEDAKESLLRSTWDLVIVDEAHKMSAYSEDKKTLAFQLGEALSQRTDHFLMMTATPHKGDPENFRLFLSLLDRDVYGDIKSLEEAMRKHSAPFYLRRLKEALVSFPDPETGHVKKLFTNREVRTARFELDGEEYDFYDELTRYVEDQSIKAAAAGTTQGQALGFAMAMLQRRFSSSVYAVRRSLERMQAKRARILEDPERFRREYIENRLPDDYDDLPEDEQQQIVADLEGVIVAVDPESLREEIQRLGKLISHAKVLEQREVESKLNKLRQVLNEQRIFSDPRMKLLVFTEHKDTLDYLVGDGRDGRPLGKLREWGLKVTRIHGSMPIGDRDSPGTRIYAEREFREDSQVLVATEAAGEGINLQFCWLMINYDIPWNPVRLEQRMGRIHRYGQQKDCLIFNFVAVNTREGRVLDKLLHRLAEIKEALGTDKVFDVVGEMLPSNLLEKMFREMYARRLTPDSIEARIVRDVDPEKFKRIAGSTLEGLAKKELNLSALIGKSVEAKERRLVPEVVEDFFLAAGPVAGVHPAPVRGNAHVYRVGRVADLPRRIHDWMPRLAEEGVVGADAIFACLGPALEIFSRHSRVERANGEVVTLGEYLEQVWAAVSREALSMIFVDADTAGLAEDARLTAMWLWTLAAASGEGLDDGGQDEGDAEDQNDEDNVPSAGTSGSGFSLEFDAARKIAQGLGARLEELSHVVQVNGDKARLLSVAERTKYLFGGSDEAPIAKKTSKKKPQRALFEELEEVAEQQGWGEVGTPKAGSTTLDRVHQAMILFGAGRADALKRFVVDEGVGLGAQFWKLAQALSALYPTGTDEKRWVDGVLARKKGLGF